MIVSEKLEKNPIDERLVGKIREEFYHVDSDLDGKRIYFDNGVGSLVLKRTVDAEVKARTELNPNKGSNYTESKLTEAAILEGRSAIADLLNAPSPTTIVQGESASDLLFKINYAISKKLSNGDNVVSTNYEHYANITPFWELKKRGILKDFRLANVNKEDGRLDLDHLRSLIDQKTKVVAVAASSNLLGSKTPLREVSKMARAVGAYFIIDAVHHVPQGPIDVQEIDCDFLVFSGYKVFGPHGSYAYVNERVFGELDTYRVDPSPTPTSPSRYELGTRDPTKFAASKAVIDYLVWLSEQVGIHYKGRFNNYSGRTRSLKVAMDAIERVGQTLSKLMLTGTDGVKGLAHLPNVRIFGITDLNRLDERDPTFSFKVKNMDEQELIDRLWKKYRIAMRVGHFWNNAHELYGEPSMARVTLLHYNTPAEIRSFLQAIEHVSKAL
jgi:selenocysteine lyase/cysteine desulfurase